MQLRPECSLLFFSILRGFGCEVFPRDCYKVELMITFLSVKQMFSLQIKCFSPHLMIVTVLMCFFLFDCQILSLSAVLVTFSPFFFFLPLNPNPILYCSFNTQCSFPICFLVLMLSWVYLWNFFFFLPLFLLFCLCCSSRDSEGDPRSDWARGTSASS